MQDRRYEKRKEPDNVARAFFGNALDAIQVLSFL